MTDPNDLADQYDATRLAGQRCIQDRWHFLLPPTRELLQASGFYSDRGTAVKNAEHASRMPEHDVGSLEAAVGVLSLCARSLLPDRRKSSAPIPPEAIDPDVPSHCADLLFLPAWRDPEFLRLGLRAIAQHEKADALAMVRVSKPKSATAGAIGGIFSAVMLYLSPAALGIALVSATHGDLAGTVAALYFVGLVALLVSSASKNDAGEDISEYERRYLAWSEFGHEHAGTAFGAGAEYQLKDLASKGVRVPSIAFDICAALRWHL